MLFQALLVFGMGHIEVFQILPLEHGSHFNDQGPSRCFWFNKGGPFAAQRTHARAPRDHRQSYRIELRVSGSQANVGWVCRENSYSPSTLGRQPGHPSFVGDVPTFGQDCVFQSLVRSKGINRSIMWPIIRVWAHCISALSQNSRQRCR